VAVDSNPDLAHHPGDCLRTADLGGPHAAAAQRRIRGSFRLGDDREYLRSANHDSPDQGHGLPRWNILWGYPYSYDFDRQTELGTKDWSTRKRAEKYEACSHCDGSAKNERGTERNNRFAESYGQRFHHPCSQRDTAVVSGSRGISNPGSVGKSDVVCDTASIHYTDLFSERSSEGRGET
jgi:hypothetical protein